MDRVHRRTEKVTVIDLRFFLFVNSSRSNAKFVRFVENFAGKWKRKSALSFVSRTHCVWPEKSVFYNNRYFGWLFTMRECPSYGWPFCGKESSEDLFPFWTFFQDAQNCASSYGSPTGSSLLCRPFIKFHPEASARGKLRESLHSLYDRSFEPRIWKRKRARVCVSTHVYKDSAFAIELCILFIAIWYLYSCSHSHEVPRFFIEPSKTAFRCPEMHIDEYRG